jgi:hypothetical protein
MAIKTSAQEPADMKIPEPNALALTTGQQKEGHCTAVDLAGIEMRYEPVRAS